MVNICRKHHNLCLPRTDNETLNSSGKFLEWFPFPPRSSALWNNVIFPPKMWGRRVMINGGDGAQNKWQASPPPGNNNNNFMICLSHIQLQLSPIIYVEEEGRGVPPLSDGIKWNKLFIISWIKNYLIKLPTTEPYIADHQNVKSNFKLGPERGWQFWHYETKANCSTCWIQPVAFFFTSLQAVYNIINGDLYIEGNDIISLQPSKLKGPPRQTETLYYYCPADPQCAAAPNFLFFSVFLNI